MNEPMSVSILFLGTGTSQGIPVVGCGCETCASEDPRDKRLRPSISIRAGEVRFIVDTSSDFRQQMLRSRTGRIDAILYTHHHFDHIGGFDDIRQFNVIQGAALDCYGSTRTLDELKKTFRYAFGELHQPGGGVPEVILHAIEPGEHQIKGVRVQAIEVMHGSLPILGYRVENFAYITDVSAVPDGEFEQLLGLDVLVLDALRHRKHETHFSLEEAIEIAQRIDARMTYFTHIAHDIQTVRDSRLLPRRMAFAYDGLEIRSQEGR